MRQFVYSNKGSWVRKLPKTSMKERCTHQSLTDIPGVGKSIANDLRAIGINRIEDLKGMDPEMLYELSNQDAGTIQDRCLLYVFRCAVYFAETRDQIQDPEKLKWWYWKDKK